MKVRNYWIGLRKKRKFKVTSLRRISPRELRRLTRKMGMEVKEIKDVKEVKIITLEKEILFVNPIVTAIKMGNEMIYQIAGKPVEREIEEEKGEETIEISEEDIQLIVAQTGVSEEEARKALIETNGDIAKAILYLQSK